MSALGAFLCSLKNTDLGEGDCFIKPIYWKKIKSLPTMAGFLQVWRIS